MLKKLMYWCQAETGKKVILLSFVLGAASVLLALIFAAVVLCASSQPMDYPPLALMALLFLGQASQCLFHIGPVLLAISAILAISHKIPRFNRRKPKPAELPDEKQA